MLHDMDRWGANLNKLAAGTRPIPTTARPPLRVVIADASISTQRQLISTLKSFNPRTEIIIIENGEEASDKIITVKPDVAFVNLELPGLTGPQAIAIARLEKVKPITVLMSNGIVDDWVRLSVELEAYEFLKKPLDPEHIVAMMNSVARMKEKLRLLLVEDSQTARTLIRKVLSNTRFNLEVDETDGGRHALKLMQLTKYDLALIDLNMEGIDGFETSCIATEISPETTLLMMSGTKNEKIENASRHFGVAAFLQKPFYAHDVDDILHDILGLRRPYLLNVTGRVNARDMRKKQAVSR